MRRWLSLGFLVCLLLSLVLPAPFIPVTVWAQDCNLGTYNDGLYTTVVVDTYVIPSGGGYVTRTRNGVDCASNQQTPAVSGGTRYFTGNFLPTLAAGYAAAPMDFSCTAVAADGWKFSHWQGIDCPRRWVVGGTELRVTYLESECDETLGRFECYAVFVPESVSINLMPSLGFVYDVPSGVQSYATFGLTPLVAHMTASYVTDYEFDTWVRSPSLIAGVDDPLSLSTYLILEQAAYFETFGLTNHWVYPKMKPKAVTVNAVTFTINPPGEGVLHWTTDNFTVGESFSNHWDQYTSDYEFVRWELTNLGCSDQYSKTASFWVLAEGAASAVAQLEDEPEREIFCLTMGVQGEGTTVPTEGNHFVQEDVSFEIIGNAEVDWQFDHWLGLPGGVTSFNYRETIKLTENSTIQAVFMPTGGGGGGPSGAAATGIWGAISNSLSAVGLNNTMGRGFVLVLLAAVVGISARKDKTLRVILPLGVLGVGIIGNWIPLWIVVLLALGLAAGLLKFLNKSGVTGGG